MTKRPMVYYWSGAMMSAVGVALAHPEYWVDVAVYALVLAVWGVYLLGKWAARREGSTR